MFQVLAFRLSELSNCLETRNLVICIEFVANLQLCSENFLWWQSIKTYIYIERENNTCARGDMEFIFECSHQYRTSERSEQVRYRM